MTKCRILGAIVILVNFITNFTNRCFITCLEYKLLLSAPLLLYNELPVRPAKIFLSLAQIACHSSFEPTIADRCLTHQHEANAFFSNLNICLSQCRDYCNACTIVKGKHSNVSSHGSSRELKHRCLVLLKCRQFKFFYILQVNIDAT